MNKSLPYAGDRHCGYSRCIKALEFHHRDPAEKDFAPGGSYVLGWERIRQEFDKCILLCANCHREEHDRLALAD
jgi:HNH endonuclease.